jgi:mono/diheme cytochrome c family protein
MTYWKLDHGIRFSAMPAFGSTLTSEQLWQITMFVARMDKLPAAVDAAWKKIPSAATP